MLTLGINSEIDSLTHVILARPRLNAYLTPENCEKNLFKNVPKSEKILSHYHQFEEILKAYNINLYFVEDLLCETLNNRLAREWIITKIIFLYVDKKYHEKIYHYLFYLPSDMLSHYLINGIKYSEAEILLDKQNKEGADKFLFYPLVNNFFTRDTSIWVHDAVFIASMKHAIRHREALIMSCIYQYHQNINKIAGFKIWFDGSECYQDQIFFEGGDIMVIDQYTLIIGHSIRTNYKAIFKISALLLNKTRLKNVLILELPKTQSYIHLDMAITMINNYIFCVSKYFLKSLNNIRCINKNSGVIKIKTYKNLMEALQKILKNDVQFITLENEKIGRREQENCANNLLTIKPGLVIGYEHNCYTNALLAQSGIQIITLPGSQLSLGNGGTHCMTCPIKRTN